MQISLTQSQSRKRHRVRGGVLCAAVGAMLGVAGASQTTAAPLPVVSVQKHDRDVTIQLSQGALRLQVCTPRVIHVTYSADGAFPEQRVPTVIAKFAPTPFKVTTTDRYITIATGQVQAQVDRKSGAVRFLDAKGNAILSEPESGGKSLTPVTLPGATPVKSFRAHQEFALPADEGIYGLGQHQDGFMDYRGSAVMLDQVNREVAIPFLVSSRGYGLLWNNPASTVMSAGGTVSTAIPPVQMLSDDGKSGGLTGTYFKGENFDTEVAKQTDSEIDFTWTNSPPAGLPKEHYSVRWTGSVLAKQGGDYHFITSTDDGARLWIDDKQIINDWNSQAVKDNIAAVKFAPNSTHKIRYEYYQGGYDAVARLRWRLPPTGDALTTWDSQAADAIDYYFFYGPSLDQVTSDYAQATGKAPMFGKWAFGLWQSKERYQTQQEWLDIAQEYRTRKEPIDNIVQDWFYWDPWPWGSHHFDPKRYPDPAAAINELHDKDHMHLMISVWGKFAPGTAEHPDENYDALNAKGYLYPPEGPNTTDRFYDAFSPDARALYWSQMRDQVFSKGVDAWWLDASEPEIGAGAFSQFSTAAGLGAQVRNAYPLMHTKGVYEGQRAVTDKKRVFILTRSGYAGQQRNAAAVWSGDITASWEVYANQIPAGLNIGLSGIPYWTTDIGAFFVNYPGGSENPEYRELFTRWFQFGAFCPLFRIHGTSTPRELWRFGPQYEPILVKYDNLRYRLMPYIYSQAWRVTKEGAVIMRPLVMDFPQDKIARESKDEFLFGPSLLVAPVIKQGAATRNVYLPKGASWTDFWTGAKLTGGKTISAPAPIDTLPLYVKAGSILPMGPLTQYVEEKPVDPIELRVYTGADGSFQLYEDEGDNYNYEKGAYATIPIAWSERKKTLTIGARQGTFSGMQNQRTFKIVWVRPGHGTGLETVEAADKTVAYSGKSLLITMP
ncbi:MAG: TIM-barrel domain-containing protein [Capsulimonas sp.]|uniref:TIM-barrel domain-containing protein n=1 Tax=Capsulimonas sp. TaxID=2494211 RepID=UPI003264A0B3